MTGITRKIFRQDLKRFFQNISSVLGNMITLLSWQ